MDLHCKNRMVLERQPDNMEAHQFLVVHREPRMVSIQMEAHRVNHDVPLCLKKRNMSPVENSVEKS